MNLKKNNCKHEDVHYYSCINEDGWKCVNCNEKLGYRPDLDVEQIFIKVFGILHDMTAACIVHVSNGTTGDFITSNVAERCKEEDLYDQYSIARFIIEDPNLAGHAEYWYRERKGIQDVKTLEKFV